MSRAPYRNGRAFRTAAVVAGLGIMVLAYVLSIETAFLLFPVFAACLFIYVTRATQSISLAFGAFLLSTMVMEICFLYDYVRFFIPATIASIVSTVFFLMLLKPVIRGNTRVFFRHNYVEFIVGFAGVSFVVGYLVYLLLPLLPSIGIFIFGLVAFVFFTTACFIIPNLNRHPDNSLLFGVGGAYIVEMCFGFIYQHFAKELIFLQVAIFMGCFVKVVFATYLARMRGIEGYDSSIGIN